MQSYFITQMICFKQSKVIYKSLLNLKKKKIKKIGISIYDFENSNKNLKKIQF